MSKEYYVEVRVISDFDGIIEADDDMSVKEAAVMIENAFPDWFPPEDDRGEDVNL